jgi:hypothetical protein
VLVVGLVLAVLGFVFQSPVVYALAAAAFAFGLWSRVRRPVRRS